MLFHFLYLDTVSQRISNSRKDKVRRRTPRDAVWSSSTEERIEGGQVGDDDERGDLDGRPEEVEDAGDEGLERILRRRSVENVEVDGLDEAHGRHGDAGEGEEVDGYERDCGGGRSVRWVTRVEGRRHTFLAAHELDAAEEGERECKNDEIVDDLKTVVDELQQDRLVLPAEIAIVCDQVPER